jgi:glycosyltransferase involved in cell wall biosynthesis
MRVLVATITHRADDARIFARQIPAMVDAGIDVVAIAPWRASGVSPDARLTAIDVPRTRGRRRIWPLIKALHHIRISDADLILVHDPELAFALSRSKLRTRVVWDVHEDLPAALATKSYLPRVVRPLLSRAAAHLERRTEKALAGLLLAEERYATRFQKRHPIVLNLPRVSGDLPLHSSSQKRVVYVGSITQARGLLPMLNLAQHLQPDGISLLLIGEIPSMEDQALVQAAPNVTWTGPLANAHALELVQESMAGLSLLGDLPNYRHSMPTKVLEYMSRGIPVISTPLPVAVAALSGNGIIVSFDPAKSVTEAATAIRELAANPTKREALRQAAFDRVRDAYNWNIAQQDFVAALKRILS